MEDEIRDLVRERIREYHTGFTVPVHNDEILQVIAFNPIELDLTAGLDNICGNVSFICSVKGKIDGIVSRNRTYSFYFTGIEAVMRGTKIIDLNLDNMQIPFYERHN